MRTLGIVYATIAAIIMYGATASAQVAARQYYLTSTTVQGSAALNACATGFHMANLFEILNPTSLVYATNIGATASDSGSGPPTGAKGWVRTGTTASGTVSSGHNCNAWTTTKNAGGGMFVWLPTPVDWLTKGSTVTSPWLAGWETCEKSLPVWCVQDLTSAP